MLAPLLAVAVLAQEVPTSADTVRRTPLHPLPAAKSQGNTVAHDPLVRGTWVIDADANKVELIRPGMEPISIAVGRWPEQLVVDSKGVVYVSCRQDNRIVRIDTDFKVTSIPTGAEPSGLFLDEAAGKLWVGLVTERALTLIDTATLKVAKQRPVGFEPGPMQLTKDGLAVLSRQGGELLFSAPTLEESEDWVVQLPENGLRRAWRGQALAQVQNDLVVVHTEIDPGLNRPATGGGYGGGGSFSTPIATTMTVVRDGKVAQRLALPSLSDVTSIAVSKNRLAIASRGNAMVVVTDYVPALQRFAQTVTLFAGEGLSGVAFDAEQRILALASFDRSLLTLEPALRPLQGDRPTWAEGQLIANTSAVRPSMPVRIGQVAQTANTVFGRSRPVFADGQRLAITDYESLPDRELDKELDLGRRLFFDTTNQRVSTSGLACVSCHPDGRQDGVVWRLNGSRRQTMLLAGRLADTAPYNWQGTTRSLEENIAQTTQRLGGNGLAKEEQHALARFLVEGLRPVTLPKATDTAVVERGRALFHDEAVGCASCHPSDGAFTDSRTHDIESVRKAEHEELSQHAAQRAAQNAPLSNVFGVSGVSSFGSSSLGGLGNLNGSSGLGLGGLGTGLGLRGIGTGARGVGGLGSSRPTRKVTVTTPAMVRSRIASSMAKLMPPPPAPMTPVKPEVTSNDLSFDTPSLRSLAVSAPYMHDGAYPTLEKLLEENHDRMGETSALSPEDIAALAAYLRTL
ncbi:MAG: hypothetical protein QM723_23330 [Myxococcaceae bacterium]